MGDVLSITKLRRFIESAKEPYSDERLRIITVSQADLWNEGVEAGKVLANGDMEAVNGNGESGSNGGSSLIREAASSYNAGRYVAGKWGRFLRAPDIYFKIMKDYGGSFVKLAKSRRFGAASPAAVMPFSCRAT